MSTESNRMKPSERIAEHFTRRAGFRASIGAHGIELSAEGASRLSPDALNMSMLIAIMDYLDEQNEVQDLWKLNAENAALDRDRLAQTKTSRWVPIVATSNSGKKQFVCLCCGRVSVTPDKHCPENARTFYPGYPYGKERFINCREWEEKHNRLSDRKDVDSNA